MGDTHAGTTLGNLKNNLAGLLGASALAAFSVFGTGCQSKLYDENVALRQQNRELQARYEERSQLAAAPVAPPPEAHPMDVPHAAVLPGPVAPPVAPLAPVTPPAPESLAPAAGTDLVGLDTSENKLTGTMTVKFLGDELFDPGSATLKDSSKKDLGKVASALKKQYAGKAVRIEGHTDSDPIKHSKWANNMELSKARADAVRKFLTGKGIPESMVTVQGFGDTKPKSTNPAEKGKNRRVEIVVLAK